MKKSTKKRPLPTPIRPPTRGRGKVPVAGKYAKKVLPGLSPQSKLLEYHDKIRAYFREEWYKKLELDKIEDKSVREFVEIIKYQKFFSIIERLLVSVRNIYYDYLTAYPGIITTSFRVEAEGTSVIYGFLYSIHLTPGINLPKPAPGRVEAETSSNYRHLYIVCSHSYVSMDGEYRNRVLPYDHFVKTYRTYRTEIEPAERLIADKLSAGSISFALNFFYPFNFRGSEKEFERELNESRLAITAYTFCWCVDYHFCYMGIEPNHINPAYRRIIFRPEDAPVYERMRKESPNFDLIRYYMMKKSTDVSGSRRMLSELEIGQKLSPLTNFEIINYDSISYQIWREVYIGNLVSNLTLNIISPSFGFIRGWFFIQNSHQGLFDNPAMIARYSDSHTAAEISAQVRRADELNYIDRVRAKGTINSKFSYLSKKLQSAIVYAESNIKLADLSLCVFGEYVGASLRDVPRLIAKFAAEEPLYPSDVFTIEDKFKRVIFEFFYSFVCMNRRLNILHGDLHLNNVTLYKLYRILPEIVKEYKRLRVCYIIDGTAYMFPYNGVYSMIIDFSRSIIGDRGRIEREFGPAYAEEYFHEQRLRVLRVIFYYFPALIERRSADIERLSEDNFPLLFKILTGVDAISISRQLGAMITHDEYFRDGTIVAHAGCVKLLSNIAKFAEAIVAENLQLALDGQITSPDDLEWINLTIINKYFADYKLSSDNIPPPADNIVCDVFNANGELKWEIEDPETWGPLLSLDKIIEMRKEYGFDTAEYEWYRDNLHAVDNSRELTNLTARYESQEEDLLKFESWMFV